MAKINLGVISFENSKWEETMSNLIGRTNAEGICATKTASTLMKGRTYYVSTKYESIDPYAVFVVNNEDRVTRKFIGSNIEKIYTITLAPNEVAIYVNNDEGKEVEIYYEESADFTPSKPSFSASKPFYFWCQTVLPLVYDDSLSYYELLNKVVHYINNLIEDAIRLEKENSELLAAYEKLQKYVNDYFDNLDVSEEIEAKLDAMAQAGDFDAIVESVLSTLNYASIINARVDEDIDGVVASQIGGVVEEQIGNTVAGQIGDTVAAQIGDTVEGQIGTVVAEQIGTVVGEQIGSEVETQIGGAVEAQIGDAIEAQIGGVVEQQIGGVVAEQIDDVVAGQLPDVTRNQVEIEVEEWLNENLSDPPIDKTLSISGAAADAEITGKIINVAKDVEIENYNHELENVPSQDFHEINNNKIWESNGELSNNSGYRAIWLKNVLVGGAKYEVKIKDYNVESGYFYENFEKPTAVTTDNANGYTDGNVGAYPTYYEYEGYKQTFTDNNIIDTGYILTFKTKVANGETAAYMLDNAGRISRKLMGDGTLQTFTVIVRDAEKSITVNNSENTVVDITRVYGNLIGYISDMIGVNPEGTYTIEIPYNCTDVLINAEINYGFTIKLKTNHFEWLGIPYRTTAPTAAYTGTGLGVVVLTSDPATKYDGWIYIITEA